MLAMNYGFVVFTMLEGCCAWDTMCTKQMLPNILLVGQFSASSTDYEFLEVKITSNILHMNCLLGYCKMTFMIHLIFTSLAGMIFRPHFTTFGSCFVIIFLKEITFFHVQYMLQHKTFYEFFSKKMFSRIHCNFVFLTFLNGLSHSMHGTLCLMKFSKLKIVFNILHMNYFLGLRDIYDSSHFHIPCGHKIQTTFHFILFKFCYNLHEKKSIFCMLSTWYWP